MKISEHIEYLSQLSPSGEGDVASTSAINRELPAFLRALLVADGTVTVLLRAFFDEAIQIRTQGQSALTLELPISVLKMDSGEEAFQRQVELSGSNSGTLYATATSILNPAAMPDRLFDALIRKDVGMGEVLRNSARGSYREILSIDCSGNEAIRTYLVYLDGRPAILITETFFVSAFNGSV